jgi:hypothetical protein
MAAGVGARWQVEPCRIGTVDDIGVVVARQHQRKRCKLRMTCEPSKQLGPFRRWGHDLPRESGERGRGDQRR